MMCKNAILYTDYLNNREENTRTWINKQVKGHWTKTTHNQAEKNQDVDKLKLKT